MRPHVIMLVTILCLSFLPTVSAGPAEGCVGLQSTTSDGDYTHYSCLGIAYVDGKAVCAGQYTHDTDPGSSQDDSHCN